MGRKSTRQEIDLSDGDRERLEGIVNNPRSLQKHVWRARIVLAFGSGRGRPRWRCRSSTVRSSP